MNVNAKLVNSVAAVIVRDQKVLVIETADSHWEFPWGNLQAEEKVDDAVLRIVGEKLKLSVSPVEEVGSVEVDISDTVEIVMFIAVDGGDLSRIVLSEGKSFRLVAFEELKNLNLMSFHRLFIDQCEVELKRQFQ